MPDRSVSALDLAISQSEGSDNVVDGSGKVTSTSKPGCFAVLTRERIYSWGITYRLRLDDDVVCEQERLGLDALGAPAQQRRSFVRPAGWEIDVTLIGRELEPGDTVAVEEIANAARLWTSWH